MNLKVVGSTRLTPTKAIDAFIEDGHAGHMRKFNQEFADKASRSVG